MSPILSRRPRNDRNRNEADLFAIPNCRSCFSDCSSTRATGTPTWPIKQFGGERMCTRHIFRRWTRHTAMGRGASLRSFYSVLPFLHDPFEFTKSDFPAYKIWPENPSKLDAVVACDFGKLGQVECAINVGPDFRVMIIHAPIIPRLWRTASTKTRVAAHEHHTR